MIDQPPDIDDGSVERLESLQVTLTCAPWPFAEEHVEAIASNWARRSAENPSFWDGEVLVLRGLRRAGKGREAVFSRERFSSFLYWRDFPALDPIGLDGFGSAIIRSAEGHVLVGKGAAATLNAGLVYLPGGFIDARDARSDGTVDVSACAAREVAEEIGVSVADLERVPGVLVARHGRHCSFATEWRSSLSSGLMLQRLREQMARQGDQEMRDIELVRTVAELHGRDVIGYAGLIVRNLLAQSV